MLLLGARGYISVYRLEWPLQTRMLSRSSSWQIMRWNRIQARGCHNVLLCIEKTFALAILILHVCVLSVNGPAMENMLAIFLITLCDLSTRPTTSLQGEWSLTTWCEKPNSYASFSKSLREILLDLRKFSARFLAPLSRTTNVEMPVKTLYACRVAPVNHAID